MAPEPCPIPNSHRRLEQSHLMWHQCLEAYHDADPFQANLNATIEALRSVTFMLQSEKSAIADFDVWYEGWRTKMKADSALAWLQNARTTVVHKADLETTSSAVATVHNNLTQATTTCELPPFLPLAMACTAVADSLPEPFSSNPKDLVLSLERRWSVNNLPEWELLDALAHSYEFLSDLLRDAHEKAGHKCLNYDHEGNPREAIAGRPSCMITTEEVRTVRMSLEDGSTLIPERKPITLDESKKKLVRDRYGPTPAEMYKTDDPFQLAESLLEVAKKVLTLDGHHVRLLHIRTPGGWQLRAIDAVDRVDKYVLLKRLASEVKALKGDAIVEVAEAWFLPKEELTAEDVDDPSKRGKEVLLVSVAIADGRFRSYVTPFHRDESGSVVLDQTQVDDSDMPTYMAPFCAIWDLPIPKAAEEA